MTIKAIDRAKAHYKRLVDEPSIINVPEWSDDSENEPFEIYFTPLTLEDRIRLNKHASNSLEMAAEILILKAKDKNGAALFLKEDKVDLKRFVDSAVLARIAKQLAGITEEELFEEAEKN